MSSHVPGFRDLIEATSRIEAKIATIEGKLDGRVRQLEFRMWFINGVLAAGQVVLGVMLTVR